MKSLAESLQRVVPVIQSTPLDTNLALDQSMVLGVLAIDADASAVVKLAECNCGVPPYYATGVCDDEASGHRHGISEHLAETFRRNASRIALGVQMQAPCR